MRVTFHRRTKLMLDDDHQLSRIFKLRATFDESSAVINPMSPIKRRSLRNELCRFLAD